jgi:hypothetical protein
VTLYVTPQLRQQPRRSRHFAIHYPRSRNKLLLLSCPLRSCCREFTTAQLPCHFTYIRVLGGSLRPHANMASIVLDLEQCKVEDLICLPPLIDPSQPPLLYICSNDLRAFTSRTGIVWNEAPAKLNPTVSDRCVFGLAGKFCVGGLGSSIHPSSKSLVPCRLRSCTLCDIQSSKVALYGSAISKPST